MVNEIVLFGQCAHWIPGGQHDRRLFHDGQHMWRNVLLVDHHLENELLEPIGRHVEIAFVAAVLAPRVFDTELSRCTIVLWKRNAR